MMAENVKPDDASTPADVSAEPAALSVSEAEPREQPVAAEAPADDLDTVLAEFDRLTGNRPADTEQAGDDLDSLVTSLLDAEAREQRLTAERQNLDLRLAQNDVDLALRSGEITDLTNTVQALRQQAAQQAEEARWREHQARSLTAFQALCAEEQAKLEGWNVEPDHVESWLLAAQARDPELAHAWEAQFYQPPDPLRRAELERGIMEHGNQLARAAAAIQDPTQRALAEKNIRQELQRLYNATFPDPAKYRASATLYIRKALGRMHKAAQRAQIDPNVSEDRAAVAAAIRSAGGTLRTEPAPALGKLSNAELNKFTEQFGFSAV